MIVNTSQSGIRFPLSSWAEKENPSEPPEGGRNAAPLKLIMTTHRAGNGPDALTRRGRIRNTTWIDGTSWEVTFRDRYYR